MIDVREAKAGPEMDAACARLMGWIVDTDIEGDTIFLGIPPEMQHLEYDENGRYHIYGKGYEQHGDVRWCVRQYSTRIRSAWELVEAMRVDGIDGPSVDYRGYDNKHWCALWKDGEMDFYKGTIVAYADTAPLAICRAYLLAHGITEIEDDDD